MGVPLTLMLEVGERDGVELPLTVLVGVGSGVPVAVPVAVPLGVPLGV